MRAVVRKKNTSFSGAVLLLTALALAIFQMPGASQSQSLARSGDDRGLTYTHGQAVSPVFHGWTENPDGTFNMWFSYINRNWAEEVDIPVGPNNNISPAPFGPDGGQPTHFYPRVNRWMFSVRVPKDFGNKELIWSLTRNGETIRAYATLNEGYAVDDFIIMHEFINSERGRKWPTLQVEGAKERTVRVGQSSPIAAVAHDPNPPRPAGRGGRGGAQAGSPGEIRPGGVGGDFTRGHARGLRVAMLVYRGPSDAVKFDPPIPFKVWEDQRGGSPWSPGWVPPPIPPGNRWVHNVTFSKPGEYVIRVNANDGSLFANENVRFTVTP
jgi:hypothetical protein